VFLFCVFIVSLSFFHFLFIVYLVYDFIIYIKPLIEELHCWKVEVQRNGVNDVPVCLSVTFSLIIQIRKIVETSHSVRRFSIIRVTRSRCRLKVKRSKSQNLDIKCAKAVRTFFKHVWHRSCVVQLRVPLRWWSEAYMLSYLLRSKTGRMTKCPRCDKRDRVRTVNTIFGSVPGGTRLRLQFASHVWSVSS